jgi:hypothetical protein
VKFTGNFADSVGGGLEIVSAANFHVRGGSFADNGAREGGGIFLFNASGSIRGVTISGNSATEQGGGVLNGGAMPGMAPSSSRSPK